MRCPSTQCEEEGVKADGPAADLSYFVALKWYMAIVKKAL